MKKYFIVPQPPLTEKTRFLVDDINETKTIGFTYDIDKIMYNLDLMDEEFKQELEIGMSFLENGITDVIDLGKYIAIVALKKDKTEGKITFFDTRADFSKEEVYDHIEMYSDKIIADKFIELYDLVKVKSPDNVDLFLSLPLSS